MKKPHRPTHRRTARIPAKKPMDDTCTSWRDFPDLSLVKEHFLQQREKPTAIGKGNAIKQQKFYFRNPFVNNLTV